MTPDDVVGPPVEVWPENWHAVSIFLRVDTQWRHGFSGPTGLDYVALLAVIDRATDDREERDQLFDDVRVMEISALRTMRG